MDRLNDRGGVVGVGGWVGDGVGLGLSGKREVYCQGTEVCVVKEIDLTRTEELFQGLRHFGLRQGGRGGSLEE